MLETTPPQRGTGEMAAAQAERVRMVSEALGAGDNERARELVAGLQAPDLADVVELLEPPERAALITALGADADFAFFSELEETVRDQLSEALPNELLAKAIANLETDDAAYVIETLEEGDRQDVLARLPIGDRAALERNFVYPPGTAGRLMQAEFAAVAPFWSVGQVIDYMREA